MPFLAHVAVLLVIFIYIVLIFDLLKFIFVSLLVALQRHLPIFLVVLPSSRIKLVVIIRIVVVVLIVADWLLGAPNSLGSRSPDDVSVRIEVATAVGFLAIRNVRVRVAEVRLANVRCTSMLHRFGIVSFLLHIDAVARGEDPRDNLLIRENLVL